jgi:predicted DNA-binding transcriptional regulator AlpA
LIYTLKEIIKEYVREVIRDKMRNGNLFQPQIQVIHNDKAVRTEFKNRDPLSIICTKELCEMLLISVTTLWRWETGKKMPPKVKLAERAVGGVIRILRSGYSKMKFIIKLPDQGV